MVQNRPFWLSSEENAEWKFLQKRRHNQFIEVRTEYQIFKEVIAGNFDAFLGDSRLPVS